MPGKSKYACLIGSTPQPRSRRVLRALLAHSRLPNAQACTPKQTALDTKLHQHTFGAALLPLARHDSAIGAGPLLDNSSLLRPHTKASVPLLPSVISPSLPHPIKRVWYVNIRENHFRLRPADSNLHCHVLDVPALSASASFLHHRVFSELLLISKQCIITRPVHILRLSTYSRYPGLDLALLCILNIACHACCGMYPFVSRLTHAVPKHCSPSKATC